MNYIIYIRIGNKLYNTCKSLKKHTYFYTHLFCINDQVGSITEVYKKHDQNLKENDFQDEKQRRFFYEQNTAGIH